MFFLIFYFSLVRLISNKTTRESPDRLVSSYKEVEGFNSVDSIHSSPRKKLLTPKQNAVLDPHRGTSTTTKQPGLNNALNNQSPSQNQPCLHLWAREDDKWVQKEALSHNSITHYNGVTDISWASLNARSYHSVVSCGKDGVIVWNFRISERGKGKIEYIRAKLIKMSSLSKPIRCSWNFMATVIVVLASDRTICIWKRVKSGDWKKESEIQGTVRKSPSLTVN